MSSLLEQIQFLRQSYPGMLLLFRYGDFYELYEEDAERAAQYLPSVTPVTRTSSAGDVYRAVIIPQPKLEAHLRTLLQAGLRVAVVERVE